MPVLAQRGVSQACEGGKEKPKSFSVFPLQIQPFKHTYIYLQRQSFCILMTKSSTLTCIWNESALNVSGCQNEMLGAWWKANKEDKVWSLDTVQNEIKPCMACQGCQLIFISKAHYSITLQLIAYSSVFFNSSHSSPHLLSLVCQQWKKSVNWQMSVTNVNWCLYISGRCSLFCFLLDLLLA